MAQAISRWGYARLGSGNFWGQLDFWSPILLRADSTGITLKVWWKRYFIDRGSVAAVRQCYGSRFLPFMKGVQILHTRLDCPSLVVFHTFGMDRLFSELQQLEFDRRDDFDWENWSGNPQ